MGRSLAPARVLRYGLGVALCLVFGLPVGLAGAQDPSMPWLDPSLSAEQRVSLLLPQMTLEEKVALMTGDPPQNTGAYFNAAIPRLGIPELRTADIGPGVRFGWPTTAFPMGIATAATWNTDWGAPLGAAVAEEARDTRHNMVLGPNVDLPRNPFWSRIGESFGEDPLLSGLMAAGFVRGAQARGDMAVNLKHYNLYTQETNRRRGANTQNSVVDERTIRELYTRPWATAVAAGLDSVMCAYNRINGEHACEHGYMQEQVLRRGLGFDGFILSDFGATYGHTVDAIEDGLDLETGAINTYGPALLAAVQDGRVSEALVDQRVRNILRVYFRHGVFDRPLPATNQRVPIEEHGGMAREIEQEAITLLKNRNAALPLQRPRAPQSIAVLGEGATWAAQQCCAGAVTSPAYTITPLQGIRQRAPSGVDVNFERGSDAPAPSDLTQGPDAIPSSVLSPPDASGQTGVRAEFWNNTAFSGAPFATRTDLRPMFDTGPIQFFAIHPEVAQLPAGSRAARYTGTITAPRTGSYRLSLSGFGTGRLFFDGREIVSFSNQIAPRAYVSDPIELQAGESYEFRLEYAATNPRDSLDPGSVRLGWVPPEGTLSPDVQAAVDLARDSDVAVVVAGLYEAEARDRGELDLPTEQDELIDAVSRVNPRTIVVLQTGGPVTMPWIGQVDGIVQLYYGGEEQGRALADVLFGDVNPSGKLPVSYPRFDSQPTNLGIQNPLLNSEVFDVPFSEGVFMGYRGYERAGTRMQFPFGYGLSYTRFQYRNAQAENRNGQVSVSFTLRNTGDRTGAEVAQIYAGKLPTNVSTPPRQLAGWAKVTLDPGERRRVTVQLACKSLSYWDPGANTDAGQTEGQANTADPNSTDPPSTNTDGHWITPTGQVTIHVGSSVQDIRLTDTVALRGGTCAEGSDNAAGVVDDDTDEDDAGGDTERALARRRSAD